MMRTLMNLACAAALSCAVVISPARAACEDDPRFATLDDVVDQIEAGETIEPIAVTPMTFLDMNPYIRRGLSGYLALLDPETCAPTQLVAEMAVTRTEVPFDILFSRFFDAVIVGDTITPRVILGGYTAAPLPAAQVLGLGGRTGFPTPLAAELAKAAGMELHTAHNANGFGSPVMTNRRDPNTGEVIPLQVDISLLDFYVRFGGRTSDPGSRIYLRVDYCDSGYNCNFWDVAGNTFLRTSAIGQWTHAMDGKRLAALLQQANLETVDGGHIAGETRNEYRREYLATRAQPEPEAGGEAGAPSRSLLFD